MEYDFKGKEYDILEGDCLRSLQALPDGCVNTIVTSPPYYGLRNYGNMAEQIGQEDTPDAYIERLVGVFRECRRVLRDDGTLWLNLGDTYNGNKVGNTETNKNPRLVEEGGTFRKKLWCGCKEKDLIGIPWMAAFALRADGWYLRSDIIWEKANSMPQSVKDRVSCSHEYIFMLAKSPRYYFDYEAIEEEANYDGRKDTLNKGSPKYADDMITADDKVQGMAAGAHQRWKFKSMPKFGGTKYPDGESGADGTYSGREWQPKVRIRDTNLDNSKDDGSLNPMRNRHIDFCAVRRKRDVWTVPTKGYSGAHFATYPEKLIEPCILAGCPIGGVVLDPFNGSGTTGCVALKNHRRYIGLELNPEYVKLAHERIDSETAQKDFLDVLGVQK